MKDMDKGADTIIIERLEALKMLESYKELFKRTTLIEFGENELALHLIAQDCAMVEVTKIIGLHINKNHENLSYWLDVREYLEII
jgi:hypothetical protein